MIYNVESAPYKYKYIYIYIYRILKYEIKKKKNLHFMRPIASLCDLTINYLRHESLVVPKAKIY